MKLPSQRHLFDIPDDVAYLNCAYMSPLMRRVRVDQTGPKAARPAEGRAEAVSGAAAD